MNTITDTLAIVKMLHNANFTEPQAEAVAEVFKKIEGRQKEDLVTKEYFEAKLYRALLIHGATTVGAILAATISLVQVIG